MARRTTRKSKKSPATRRNLYAEVTDKIASALENGVAPWVRPWKVSGMDQRPRNAKTNRAYRGINVFLLSLAAMDKGYTDPRWVTYKQAKDLGGSVNKGEKSTMIVFWRILFKDQDGNTVSESEARGRTDIEKVFFLRKFSMFNVEQCSDLNVAPLVAPVASEEETKDLQNRAVTAVLTALDADGCPTSHGGDRACYSPGLDAIKLPKVASFADYGAYAATALHECTHATGHADRLNRDFSGRFGDEAYAFEELIAEMGSAYLCAVAGVDGTLQHPAYLANWAKVLRSDDRAIFTAASAAQKASDWLLDASGLATEGEDTPEASEAA